MILHHLPLLPHQYQPHPLNPVLQYTMSFCKNCIKGMQSTFRLSLWNGLISQHLGTTWEGEPQGQTTEPE